MVILATVIIGGVILTKGDPKEQPAGAQLSSGDVVGKAAPDFRLTDQNGQPVKLSGLRGKKVVLFFNEGIMCYPACWNQMAALGTDKKLNNEDVVSFSIVTDGLAEWGKAFKKMPQLNEGNILFDTDKTVSNQYGMLTAASSMHRGSMLGHTYLILDQKGVIRYTLDDPKMGVQNETLVNELSKI